MKYVDKLTSRDHELATDGLMGFLPAEIYDIHAHSIHADHFPPGTWTYLKGKKVLGCIEHRTALRRYIPAPTIHGLYFGLPHKAADRAAMNVWVAGEVREHGTAISRALMVVSPTSNQIEIAAALRSGLYCGIKVYHCYSGGQDTMQASIEEFAPEWMWELLHEVRGVLMLHIMRDGAIADAGNQAAVRRLCRTYPKAKLILAHIARSFSYRNARKGLHVLRDIDNAFVDTSAVCEAQAFRAALEVLGPRRILWGSDFPVSEVRGRCVTTGGLFFWLHPEVLRPEYRAATTTDMTLLGIESLISLREACEDARLTRGDIEDIFLRNALRTLAPHLPANATPAVPDEPS